MSDIEHLAGAKAELLLQNYFVLFVSDNLKATHTHTTHQHVVRRTTPHDGGRIIISRDINDTECIRQCQMFIM